MLEDDARESIKLVFSYQQLINILGYSIAFGMTAACDSSFAQVSFHFDF